MQSIDLIGKFSFKVSSSDAFYTNVLIITFYREQQQVACTSRVSVIEWDGAEVVDGNERHLI